METTYSGRSIDILGEEDTLGLDDEEVDKLLHVADEGVKSFPRNSVVFAGAELGREAVVQEELPGDLGGDGSAESQIGELERPAQNIEVPKQEDERDEGAIGNRRRPCTVSAPALSCIAVAARDIRGLRHDRSSEKNEW